MHNIIRVDVEYYIWFLFLRKCNNLLITATCAPTMKIYNYYYYIKYIQSVELVRQPRAIGKP